MKSSVDNLGSHLSLAESAASTWRLDKLARRLEGLSLDEAAEIVGRQFLVGTLPAPIAGGPQPILAGESPGPEGWGDSTGKMNPAAGREEVVARRPELANSLVFLLRGLADGAEGQIIVGRDPQVNVVLHHSSVSRAHAHLFVDDKSISVCDAGSANGTYIGARTLPRGGTQRHELHSGQQLVFGEVSMTFLNLEALLELLQAVSGPTH